MIGINKLLIKSKNFSYLKYRLFKLNDLYKGGQELIQSWILRKNSSALLRLVPVMDTQVTPCSNSILSTILELSLDKAACKYNNG